MTHSALVTGAGGFVGASLCRHLRAQGWTVLEAVHGPATGDHQFACDIRHSDEVDALLMWARDVTHVFHLAGIAFVPEANREPARAFDANLNGTVHLARAMRRLAPHARMVFAGSSGVYGPPRALPVVEDHPLSPQTVYDISKTAADQFLAFLHRSEGFDVMRMRAFNHSGPGQSDDFVLSSFARQVAEIEAGRKAPVLLVGNLDVRRDFLHVRDVVRAYELAALHGVSGKAYNVASGASHAIREALEILIEASRVPIAVETDQRRVRSHDVTESFGSFDRLTADTGWSPTTPFRDLVLELLSDWRSRLACASADE